LLLLALLLVNLPLSSICQAPERETTIQRIRDLRHHVMHVTSCAQQCTYHLHVVDSCTSADGKDCATVAPITQLHCRRCRGLQAASAAAGQLNSAAEQLPGAATKQQQQLRVGRRARHERGCSPRLLLIATAALNDAGNEGSE
jgi:hypothetical protein